MKKFLLLVVVALFAVSANVSAQDRGTWTIGPKMNIYTAWDSDTVFGLGVAARYNVLDQLRLEPGLTFLLHSHCSLDVNCDVHYLFNVADGWTLYPLAGLSANDFGDWSMGINLGGGFDCRIADRWNISAGVKYMIETHKNWDDPLVLTVGASYRF